jgi:hypothetical protein
LKLYNDLYTFLNIFCLYWCVGWPGRGLW